MVDVSFDCCLEMSFDFWLEVEDERVSGDCILLRIFLVFQSNFIGRIVVGGLLYGCLVVGMGVQWLWL